MFKLENFSKIIIGNWKLNGSLNFLENFFNKINIINKDNHQKCIVICPPFTFINQINKNRKFLLGAQDCSIYDKGSYTGEISANILKDIGCFFCIVGHSERRIFFNESDEIIYKKVAKCIENQIIPILCIGESLEEREKNMTKEVLKNQIKNCLKKHIHNHNIIIAYEPIWAIGSGLTPSIEEIDEIHNFIKFDILKSSKFKIIYGGSVNSSNCSKILSKKNVDGVLVGGASIDIEQFNIILQS